ncbi:MAG: tyrosine-protein phosphatase [Oscillospiraceae bacterium]
MLIPQRRLALQGSPNTRDLGGYPCAGGITRWGVFLRSATPGFLTGQDIETLRAYGVTTAVDLRSNEEKTREPSQLLNRPGFTVYGVPLLDQMNSSYFEGDLPGSMSGLYISLLENNSHDLVQIFEHLAGAAGACLFNCTAGKDRTGVVAMLLLHLAGVPNADIEADYTVTEVYMREVFVQRTGTLADQEIPDYIFRSLPESMRRVLRHLEENYGSAEAYLIKAGLAGETIARLRKKLIETLP